MHACVYAPVCGCVLGCVQKLVMWFCRKQSPVAWLKAIEIVLFFAKVSQTLPFAHSRLFMIVSCCVCIMNVNVDLSLSVCHVAKTN